MIPDIDHHYEILISSGKFSFSFERRHGIDILKNKIYKQRRNFRLWFEEQTMKNVPSHYFRFKILNTKKTFLDQILCNIFSIKNLWNYDDEDDDEIIKYRSMDEYRPMFLTWDYDY